MGKKSKKSKSKSSKKAVVEEVVEQPEVTVEDETENEHISADDENQNELSASKKASVEDLVNEQLELLELLRTNETEYIDLLKDFENKRNANVKARKKLERQLITLSKKVMKVHNTEISKAKKEKRQRKGPNNGGFNKKGPVPKVLCKYLGLDDDIQLARPTVMSLLSKKFKNDGMKDGQKTVLNKAAAKALGKKNGHVIEFKDQQPFVKGFYTAEFDI